MRVSGPNASITLKGIGEINGKVDVIGKVPFGSYSSLFSRSLINSNPLFSKTFGSTANASASFFNNAATLSYQGVNLDSTNNTQITNGVRSFVQDPVFQASIDLDRAIGSLIGFPNGLGITLPTINLGIAKVSGSVNLADLLLNYTASIRQQITAQADKITGILKMENGSNLNYTVGQNLTLPKSVYDKNKDGKLDITGTFTKSGTISNVTDLVSTVGASLSALSGSIQAKFNVPFLGERSVGGSIGPLYSTALNLPSSSINAFTNTWNAVLGTSTNSFSLT